MLADIVVETQTVTFPGGDFILRGISFDKLARLMVAGNRADIEAVIEELSVAMNAADKKDEGALLDTLKGLLVKLPALAAKMIAICANEPDEWQKVEDLSMATQLDALLAIGRLTFNSEDAIKNFVSGVMTLTDSIAKVNDLTPQIKNQKTGTKD